MDGTSRQVAGVLGHLPHIVAVARELSFRRAAETLNMSQPPLSRRIRLAEREVGFQIFVRDTHAVRLTPAGRMLIAEAQTLIARLAAQLQAARSLALEAVPLRIGFVHSAAHHILSRTIELLNRTCRDTVLDLQEMNTTGLIEAIRAGEIDAAFTRGTVSASTCSAIPLYDERLGVALHCGHAMARRRPIGLADLLAEPFILYDRAKVPWLHAKVASLLAVRGATPVVAHEVAALPTMLSLVGAREGIAIVPMSARVTLADPVIVLPLSDPDAVTTMALVTRPGLEPRLCQRISTAARAAAAALADDMPGEIWLVDSGKTDCGTTCTDDFEAMRNTI